MASNRSLPESSSRTLRNLYRPARTSAAWDTWQYWPYQVIGRHLHHGGQTTTEAVLGSGRAGTFTIRKDGCTEQLWSDTGAVESAGLERAKERFPCGRGGQAARF